MTAENKKAGLLLRNAGLFNPVLVQAVGLCPVVAMATSLRGSALLALVAAVVITFSEVIASLCMKRMVRWVRIGLYILLGGVIVLPFMLFLEKNEPELFSSLGLYLPIMAVNSLVVLRCERFAVKIRPLSALRDGLTASLGYAAVLIATGLIREILGSGSVGGFVFRHGRNLSGLLLPFGGFLIIGFFAAALRNFISTYWSHYLDKKQPKPGARRKPKKISQPIEPEAVPDFAPDETPFSLEDIDTLPTEPMQEEVEESEAQEVVYTPVQPEAESVVIEQPIIRCVSEPPVEAVEPEPPVAVVEPEPPVEAVEPEPPVAVVEPEPPVAVVEPEPPVAVVEPEPPVEMVEPEPPVEAVEPEPPVAVVEPEPPVAVVEPEPPVEAVEPEPPVEEHETDFAPLEVPQVGDVFTKADESEDGQIPSDFMKRMNHYIQVQQYDTDERVKQAQEHGKAKEEQKDYSAFATPLKERKPTTERKWEKKPVVLMEDDDELEALLNRSLDDVMRDKKEEKP